ncbi:MAG: stage IV sporulation protein A, partial [Oscillospiraceae bacterium]
SISDIPRQEYEQAEEKVISELKEINKPFIVLLNCVYPHTEQAKQLALQLQIKHGVPVLPVSCMDLEEKDIREILGNVLLQFPIKEIQIDIPKWIVALEKEHWLKKFCFDSIFTACSEMTHIMHLKECVAKIDECEHIEQTQIQSIDLGTGSARLLVKVNGELFYKILGETTGFELQSEEDLMPCMIELAAMKREYDKIKGALQEVNATGYGIVMPTMEELTLEEPEIVKQGGRFGVKLRASAPSVHMMRADITAEVSPIVGSEKQSQELVKYLLEEFEENPKKIWESNIFGKSLHELVNEGLHNKLYHMPSEARIRLQETIERVINEGCNGLICIIL